MANTHHTLSRADYVDDGVWEAERERIFHASWMLALRADVVAPGSRTVVNLAGESVIITCDQSGELHAFANVCRHRGARLCERTDVDHRTAITCPYHAWSYSLDGRLVATPHLTDDDLDKSTLPLWSYHVREWRGFVFVSLAADPPDFDEWLHREFAELVALERWGFEHLIVGHTSWTTVAANWKIVMENYQECLHCTKVHPELVEMVPLYRSGWTWDRSRPQGGVVLARGHSFSDQEVSLPLLPGLSDDDAASYFGGSGFPNCFIDVTGTSAILSILYPTSPTSTLVRTDYLFHPDTVKAEGFDPSPIVEFSDLVTAQDNGVCEAVQRGVTSRAFEHGVLTPKDDYVIEFVARYRRHMGTAD
jgi:Rieske 2Fe-2S family protein